MCLLEFLLAVDMTAGYMWWHPWRRIGCTLTQAMLGTWGTYASSVFCKGKSPIFLIHCEVRRSNVIPYIYKGLPPMSLHCHTLQARIPTYRQLRQLQPGCIDSLEIVHRPSLFTYARFCFRLYINVAQVGRVQCMNLHTCSVCITVRWRVLPLRMSAARFVDCVLQVCNRASSPVEGVMNPHCTGPKPGFTSGLSQVIVQQQCTYAFRVHPSLPLQCTALPNSAYCYKIATRFQTVYMYIRVSVHMFILVQE